MRMESGMENERNNFTSGKIEGLQGRGRGQGGRGGLGEQKIGSTSGRVFHFYVLHPLYLSMCFTFPICQFHAIINGKPKQHDRQIERTPEIEWSAARKAKHNEVQKGKQRNRVEDKNGMEQ